MKTVAFKIGVFISVILFPLLGFGQKSTCIVVNFDKKDKRFIEAKKTISYKDTAFYKFNLVMNREKSISITCILKEKEIIPNWNKIEIDNEIIPIEEYFATRNSKSIYNYKKWKYMLLEKISDNLYNSYIIGEFNVVNEPQD